MSLETQQCSGELYTCVIHIGVVLLIIVSLSIVEFCNSSVYNFSLFLAHNLYLISNRIFKSTYYEKFTNDFRHTSSQVFLKDKKKIYFSTNSS